MRIIHPLIEELIELGLEVVVTKDGYKLDGFYKSGSVEFKEVEGEEGLDCHQRYDRITRVESLSDIVLVNFYWWELSKARGWGNPDGFWAEQFKALNLVKIKTSEVWESK